MYIYIYRNLFVFIYNVHHLIKAISHKEKHAYRLEKLQTFSKLVVLYIHYYKAETIFNKIVLSLEDSLDPMLEATTYTDQLIHVLVGHLVQDDVLELFLLLGREFAPPHHINSMYIINILFYY